MKLGARIAAAFAGLTGKSFAASAAAWMRGDDLVDGAVNRLAQPYAQSAWIRAAVNHIAGEISGRPLKFYDGERELEDPAFLDWWAAPALGPKTFGATQPRLPLSDALRDLAAWGALEGETFVCFDDAWLIAGSARNPAARTPFLIANPDRMQIIVSGDMLMGWRYTAPGGRQMIFLPEQVVHWRAFNPYDDWRGVGGLQAARVAAEGAFLTGTYIRDLMRNNGDTGFIVVGKNGVATDEQRAQITADLRAKRAALRRGVAKDLFLTGDIAVERPKEQAAGADLVGSQAMSEQEVFVAFGVPPSMATVKQAYSIGKDSDRYQLITGTCMPAGTAIAGSLAKVASRMTGRTLTAELDWDDHPVMVEVRTGRIDSLVKLFGMGVPVKVANEYLDLGLAPFPGWEVGYLPFSVAPTEAVASGPSTVDSDPKKDPALAEPVDEDPAVSQLKLLVLARSRTRQCVNVTPKNGGADPFPAFACECAGVAGVEMKARDAKEIAQWRTLMSKRRETVKSFEGAFGRVLMAARQETLRKIEAKHSVDGGQKTVDGVTAKAAAVDFLFDLAKFVDAFTAAMRDRQKLALDTSGKQLFAEVGKADPFAYPPAKVLDYLAGRENKLRDVPSEIFEEIKAAIEEGLLAGESTKQLSDRVRTAFNGVSSERARRIAMTETGAAYGAGRDEAMVQAGVQYKRWLTSGNANVRAAHAAANGQTVRIDEPFDVDGEALMYPGDDSGSAGNVINCHCVSIAVAGDET